MKKTTLISLFLFVPLMLAVAQAQKTPETSSIFPLPASMPTCLPEK